MVISLAERAKRTLKIGEKCGSVKSGRAQRLTDRGTWSEAVVPQPGKLSVGGRAARPREGAAPLPGEDCKPSLVLAGGSKARQSLSSV